MRALPAVLAITLTGAATTFLASPASAHTPVFEADCDGIVLSATAYDVGQDNRWSITIDGVTHTGVFGDSFSRTFPVPQGGKSTTWSAFIEAWDGSFHGQDAGTVGPCGQAQPDDETRVEEGSDQGCSVSLAGTTYGPGELTWDEVFVDTYVWDDASQEWELVTDTTPDFTNIVFTPWSTQDMVHYGCEARPPKPAAIRKVERHSALNCGDLERVITTTTTTWKFTYDAATNTWVKGEPKVRTKVKKVPVAASVCTEVLDDSTGGGTPQGPSSPAGPDVAPAQASAPTDIRNSAPASAPAAAPAAPNAPKAPGAVDAGVAGRTVPAVIGGGSGAAAGTGLALMLVGAGLALGGVATTRRGRS